MWKNREQRLKYNFLFGCLIVLCILLLITNVASLYSTTIILIHFDEIINLVRDSFPAFMTSDRAICFFYLIALMTGTFGVFFCLIFIFSHNPRHWKRTCIMSGILALIVVGSTAWDLMFFPEQSHWKLRLLLHFPYPLFALYQRNIYTKNS